MATWMTAGDFALLQKPAAGAGDAFVKQLPDFATPTVAGIETNGANPMNDPAAGLPNLAPESSATPVNPYLQALEGSPGPTAGTGPELGARPMLGPVPGPPQSLPAWLSPSAPEPSRAGQLVPDNLKPSDDSKYFPQLKRF